MSSEVPPPDPGLLKEVIETTALCDPCPICHSTVHPDSKEWIQCDECEIWYHEVCEGLTVVPNDDKYICNSCKKKKNLPPSKTQTPLKTKASQPSEEVGDRKRRGRRRKDRDTHNDKPTVKQESSTYRNNSLNFDTVDDNVKAYGGIDYNSVYKKKKDADTESIERYQRREFIPGRKAFWKRYQQEIKQKQPTITNELVLNPIQQRKHLLSISHKCSDVDDLAKLSKYVVAKRAQIEVKKEPEEEKAVDVNSTPLPTSTIPTPTTMSSSTIPAPTTIPSSTIPTTTTMSSTTIPTPTTMPTPTPIVPPSPTSTLPSKSVFLPSTPTVSSYPLPSAPSFFSTPSPSSIYNTQRTLPLPTITPPPSQQTLSFPASQPPMAQHDPLASELSQKKIIQEAPPVKRSKPSRFDMSPSSHDVYYSANMDSRREVDSRRSSYRSRSNSRYSYHRRRSDSRSSSRSDSRSSRSSYSRSRSRSSSRSRSPNRSRNRSSPYRSHNYQRSHQKGFSRHDSPSYGYDSYQHQKHRGHDHHRRDSHRDSYGRDDSRGRYRDY